VERERGVIQEEIRMYDDQPHSVAGEMLNRQLWPGNALGSPITGTPQTVASMKRGELMAFWRRGYQPRNLVVSIAGKIECTRLKELFEPHLRRNHPVRPAGTWTPVRIPQRRRMGVCALARPVQQANLALGIRTVSRKDPRRYALKLLSILLGENMSSRLFQSVREKHGLAYSVHSSTQHFNDAGALYIQAGLDPENLGKASTLIARELVRLKQRSVSAAELRRAKDYAIGQMKLALESTSNQMMWMGESMIGMDRILNPAEVEHALRAVTVDEVCRMAEELFRPGCVEAVCVGPELEDAALAGALEPLQRI
jgi:predicted Zn-dependent peptidase